MGATRAWPASQALWGRVGVAPGQAACLQGRRRAAGQDAATGGVRGKPMRQGEAGLEPGALAVPTACHGPGTLPRHAPGCPQRSPG